MKHKPIRIDWEDLEDAFNNPNEEIVYYLDLVTGHVVMEGEGEEGDDDETDFGASSVPQPEERDDATRAYVVPLDLARRVEWMEAFIREQRDLDPALVSRLKQGLEADDPVPVISQALADHPEERDRWYLFRSERLHEILEAWVAEIGIEPIDPPPWREA